MSEISEKKAEWYILHTYSGYENKVKDTIEQIVKNRDLGEYIQRVEIPEEVVIENNKTIHRKLYPCYVMLKMVMNTETWYICRNVAGSTGFVSQDSKLNPGTDAVPLTQEEVEALGLEASDEKVSLPDIDLHKGDAVSILLPEYEGFAGIVDSVNNETRKVMVVVEMFNRETTAEVDYSLIKKL